ncbi:MAG: MerR family transcriptional regulator [Dehalococcoidia bacterium]|nr:MerR family transcriptional regulator [Dehalococcoidia bacterium]|tara:strand:- start:126 stop:470 length:345 start_codon:yes stop_codon:yes gene_type:complete
MTNQTDQNALDNDEPYYVISVVARMLQVHTQTLRYYEREGLLEPARSKGNIRLYSRSDIDKLRRIKTLIDDLGINLAGVQVVLHMSERMYDMERKIQKLNHQLDELKNNMGYRR